MFSRNHLLLILALFWLGSCVSQQKYKSLLQARDNLELKATDYSVQLAQERTKALSLQNKNQDLDRQLMQINVDNQRLTRELDQLRKFESNLSADHQELTLKFEDMRDYFDIVLNECDKDKIAMARKQRELQQQEDSIKEVLLELRTTETLLLDRERQVRAWEAIANGKSAMADAIQENLNQSLNNLISDRFSISRQDEAVKISIDESVIFETGSLVITDYGSSALEQLAIALNGLNNIKVCIIGHTDPTRIAKKAKYLTDNWDLSVLKAAAVTRELMAAKLDPLVVKVAGRGEMDPMVSNHTPEGREKNKRTEIVITTSSLDQANLNKNLQNTN